MHVRKKYQRNKTKQHRGLTQEEEELSEKNEIPNPQVSNQDNKDEPNQQKLSQVEEQKSDSESDIDPLKDLDVDAPPEYLCPITMSIMKDPVIMPDGQTYEREAIQQALKVNPISPITREPMSIDQAKTNYALKSLIDKYIQENIHEIKKEPTIIDPDNFFKETPKTDSEIPVIQIKDVKLDTFSAVYTKESMLITVKPQSTPGRLPVSIIAVIDTSGSMRNDETLKSSTFSKDNENDSITRIQLVQYSLKTIISTLGDNDQISLITFDDRAKVEASSIKLTMEGKEKVSQIIDKIRTSGMTNLWDGIDKGIDEAVGLISREMNTSIMVFTDGMPNVNPPMGIIPTLKEKLSEINVLFSISTFGYGSSIRADILEEIAELGNGIYGYIPDASMVGTVFVNYISSLISEISPINILTVNQKKFDVILYNGSSTNLMINLNENDNPENIQINLRSVLTDQTFLVNEIKKLDENDQQSVSLFRDQKYRKALIDLILSAKFNMSLDELDNSAISLFEKMRNESDRSQFMKYLMIDLYNDDEQHGEIERACRKNNYKKWGKNYLFSMLRFHTLEQCGNFRDMSLQLYGNEFFVKFRKFGNKIFMNLPIPQKSSQYSSDDSSSSSPPRRVRNIKARPRKTFSSSSDDSSSSPPPPRRVRNIKARPRKTFSSSSDDSSSSPPPPRRVRNIKTKSRKSLSSSSDDSSPSQPPLRVQKNRKVTKRRSAASFSSSEEYEDSPPRTQKGRIVAKKRSTLSSSSEEDSPPRRVLNIKNKQSKSLSSSSDDSSTYKTPLRVQKNRKVTNKRSAASFSSSEENEDSPPKTQKGRNVAKEKTSSAALFPDHDSSSGSNKNDKEAISQRKSLSSSSDDSDNRIKMKQKSSRKKATKRSQTMRNYHRRKKDY